jgi:hypothetical protein
MGNAHKHDVPQPILTAIAPTDRLLRLLLLYVCHCCPQAAGESYGKQRQWGSIGFGLSSLPAGWLIGQTGLTSCFLVYGLASLPLIAVTSLMQYNYRGAAAAVAAAAGTEVATNGATQQQKQKQSTAEAGGQGMQQQQMSGLLRQPAVLLFLWRCLLLGLGMGVMANYEFLWLKQLGAPETLMGFAIAVSWAVEHRGWDDAF